MREIGRRLVNTFRFAANVQRSYDSQFVQAGAKVGLTVNARLPQRYVVNKGAALVIQNVVDTVVPVTLTDQANIGIEFSSQSLAMEVDDYREKCIAPAVDSLVNVVDFDGLTRMYQETYHEVGTPGTVPGSTGTLPQAANDVYLGAGVKLSENAVPPDDRCAMLSPNMHAYLVSANVGLFAPSGQIAEQYRSGMFGKQALGVNEWFMDQNVATHTVGALGGTPLVNGANQTGSSIITDGWTASVTGVVKKGDILTFASVNAVNPLTYQDTGQLQDFVVTADADSDGSGDCTISISPSITTSGALKTCTISPANNAVILIFGHASSHASVATPQGLIYHKEAYCLVMADLDLPSGLWVSERISNKSLGIAVRFLKDYNVMTDQSPARVDLLYGWKAVRPEMGCRVSS
jgi:hypothetical protein